VTGSGLRGGGPNSQKNGVNSGGRINVVFMPPL
jgi:hypothetical protein